MCGVFGVSLTNRNEAARYTFLGLYALQHRGQESCGIVTSDGEALATYKAMGLVSEVFNDERLLRLPGRIGIGHVRYPRPGQSSVINALPLLARSRYGKVAIAHDGSLVNADELSEKLQAQGVIFQTATDSEIILNLIAQADTTDLEQAVIMAARQLQGAFALVIMTEQCLIGIRDPLGIRPLCLGKTEDGYVLASESCALSTVGAEFIRDVLPGEMIVIGSQGFNSYYYGWHGEENLCIFEYIYFARPDSIMSNRSVYQTRLRIGSQLAKEINIAAEVVVPAPDSGVAAALGFAKESGIPFELGLIKNRYVGRTFIQPTQAMRELGVKIKLNPVNPVLKGKKVILIDDSVVRGTTSAKTVQLLREVGVAEVHLIVASPPYISPCYYGINTSGKSELIAANYSLDEIRAKIGPDSISFLSLDGLYRAVGNGAAQMCRACFTGEYPVPIPGEKPNDEYKVRCV
ncbi:MAG: amidophosphoribosyltransferase [Firmicutes bacterium]|nr:amidophosphoribosyltransferase [Bacillota bacterium]